jgi:ankyrin repeat protein
LLQHHADPNITNHIGNTPLHTYVKYGLLHKSYQELFLQKGANTNIRNNHGDTPLHLSIKCMNGHLSKLSKCNITVGYYAFIYQCLIDAGADPNIPDSNNVTPLNTACKYGTKRMVAELLYAGAVNVNNDDAPLHYMSDRFKIRQRNCIDF